MSYNDKTALVSAGLDLAEAMIKNGAEVSRIEDSVKRVFESYGAFKTDVLAISSSIVATVVFPGIEPVTQTKRITETATDFEALSQLNQLCRDICAEKPSPDEIRERTEKILKKAEDEPKSKRILRKFIAYILAAGGFTVFFGGGIKELCAASIVAVIIACFELVFKKKGTNAAVYAYFCTLAAAVSTVLLCRLFGISSDTVIIGFIMIEIPGVMFTNSVRDIFLGDTISGALKMLESLLLAVSIACGVASALFITGGRV
ncbi:MAG: threonine/serine exporter family protein [Clostridia bacterium]|nr:threonine/serine exporter family protein [Clostridia bacterium]